MEIKRESSSELRRKNDQQNRNWFVSHTPSEGSEFTHVISLLQRRKANNVFHKENKR
jgi:hypothetical protein